MPRPESGAPTALHSLLKRQLRRRFGQVAPTPPELAGFIADVDAAYREADEDRSMLERSLDLSSQELFEANARQMAEKERLAISLYSIGEGVITADMEGRISLINRVASEITGWGRDDATGRPIEHVFHVTDEQSGRTLEAPQAEVLRRTELSLSSQTGELTTRQGRRRLVSYNLAPICQHDGVASGVVVAFRDISDERKLEEERVRASRLESVGLLAGGIAHDFNNILTILVGNLSLAQRMIEEGQPDRVASLLDDAHAAGDRARDLTFQLLTFSKGGAPIRKTASIDELLHQSASFALRGSNVRFELDIAEDLLPVRVDRGQLSQVMNNLVINADQAMPQGGRIEIGAANIDLETLPGLPIEGRWAVRIWVRDHGVGIPGELIDKIFDPYFTTKETGNGLGLATSYSVVKKHEGLLTVESEVGSGSTFFIYLPAAEQPAERAARTDRSLVTRPGGERVLIMDDEPSMLVLAQRMLEYLGCRVEVAHHGHDAIELHARARDRGDPFGLMILDLTIPGGMGGRETASRLRALDPEVRLVASSGYSNAPVMADHVGHGFCGILPKPYDLQQLAKVLSSVLDGVPEPPPRSSDHERSPTEPPSTE